MATPPTGKFTVLIMSVAAGVAVANTYYSQSIIKALAVFFAVSESQAGILPALSVAGYGLGLFLLTPLGDRVNRKKLILIMQSMLMIVLTGMSLTTNYSLMCLMSLFTGFFSITAQLVIPMAAALDPGARSKNIGTIVTGLLTGMLAARAFSGYITTLLGWTYVYAFSAALILITSVLLYFTLPNIERRFDGNYIELLRSALWQLRRFSQLRSRALLGALIFALFCSFWTTLTLHLGGAPFYFRADTIGLFSFIGIAGALTTLAFGKIIRPDNIDRLRMLTTSLMAAAALLLLLFPFSIYALITAVVLLDMGVQATQLTSLSTIYQLDEKAHSRINTVYMTTCFAGGGLGTWAGLACWKFGGWNMVIWQLLALAAAAMIVASFISAKERASLPVSISQKVTNP